MNKISRVLRSAFLITDLHLYNKPKGHLDAQVNAIKAAFATACDDHQVYSVVIMGDVFMRRHPSPSEIIAFKRVLDYIGLKVDTVDILRGNHDAESKNDDGITALSVYSSDTVTVHTFTHKDDWDKRVYIPHYEDERRILYDLAAVPEGFTVFGHFGFKGCLNSVGDQDFNLNVEHFVNRTYLGHIHHYKKVGNTTIIGTPYTTNFGEAGKAGYYAVLDGEEDHFYQLKSGPRHVVMKMHEVQDKVQWLNDKNWFTLLRIILDPEQGMTDLPEELDVAHVDFKYAASFDGETQSSWRPDVELFQINSEIISEYVDGCVTNLDRDSIMDGYSIIKKGDPLPDED